MSANFPFVALVGQEMLKEALLWIAVDPAIGGVLVTGTRGTAKSTAARGLADLLPEIEVIAADPFNRVPGAGDGPGVRVPTPFVELPIGATEDRVIGTLDVRALLADAQRRFEPGLLARANRGVLYVDEVNLLPDHLVDVLLDAAATGTNVVERDGASYKHDARIVLVGTMNPEEGELRPQLLDRFGLCVAMGNELDFERRVEIVSRRMAFERDAASFLETHWGESAALRARVVQARQLLPRVAIDRASLQHAAALAIEARADGMRADLTICRTACAIAALAGRSSVTRDDVERAAVPALLHRRRDAPPPAAPRPPASLPRERAPRHEAAGAAPAAPEQTFEVGVPADLHLAMDKRRPHARAARRFVARGHNGVEVVSGVARVVSAPSGRVAALATIAAAARECREPRAGAKLRIGLEHVRFLKRIGRERQLVVFLVDASGSMAAAARMRAAKGVICALLEDAYRRRDAVALVAFRGASAQVLVPPTRSAVLAFRRLRSLPTGGRTPLAAGLRGARELIAQNARRDPAARAHLVVLSDARANAPAHDALGEALREAALLRGAGLRVLWVDTESGRIRLRHALGLASALDAQYRHLDECSERALGATVREWMASA